MRFSRISEIIVSIRFLPVVIIYIFPHSRPACSGVQVPRLGGLGNRLNIRPKSREMVESARHRASTSSLFPGLSQEVLSARLDALQNSFSSATSASDLSKLIQEIDAENRQIDSQLLQFVEVACKEHTLQISLVELNRAKLLGAIANSNDLTRVFMAANDLGHSLTSKIKVLDHEIDNVNKTLSFVSDTQSLKSNINEIKYTVEKLDWEQAARCIHHIKHNLNPHLIDGQFASAVVPLSEIPELPGVTIDKWVSQLTEEFTKLFNDAAKRKSVPEISKYFQLFPLIDQPEIGLNCYSKFICSIITDTSRTLITSATEGEIKPGIYANVTSSLFESVSMMLSQHTPIITRNYGPSYPNAVEYVVTKIQREIDAQISTITDTFYDANRLDKLLQDMKLHHFNYLKKRLSLYLQDNTDDVLDSDIVSIVEVGDLINEFAAIMHHWSLYCKFIGVKYLSAATDDSELKMPELIVSSNFSKKLKNKFIPAFESLCFFYCRRSLEKAILIEELPSMEAYLMYTKTSKLPEQPPVSSVIEDVTLVVNSTLRNVLDSSQTSVVKKFASETFKILINDLVNGFLQKALNDNLPGYNKSLSLVLYGNEQHLNGLGTPQPSRTATPAPEAMGGFFKGASSALGNVVGTGSAIVSAANPVAAANSPKLLKYLVYLNTVASGQDFLEQIIANITTKNPQLLRGNFPFGIDEEKMLHVVNDEILRPFSDATGNLIKQSILSLFNQCIKGRLSSIILECFPENSEENYIVHSSSLLNDNATIIRFKESWGATMKPFKQTIHKDLLYDKLLRLVVVNTASMIEKKLFSVLKKFRINELGALKLDKDLSFIINEICEDDYELREKFVRVTQFVLLVGMDDEEYEMSSYHGGDENETGMNWVLTPLERKQIRRFRI